MHRKAFHNTSNNSTMMWSFLLGLQLLFIRSNSFHLQDHHPVHAHRIYPSSNVGLGWHCNNKWNRLRYLQHRKLSSTTYGANLDQQLPNNIDTMKVETPSFQDCITFALPALGIYACPPLMSLIDASFIGRLSTSTELAALGPASSISDCAPLPLLFLSIASTNLIAKAFARQDKKALARVSRTALGMGLVGGIVLAVILYAFASPLSVLYCGGDSVLSSAAALAPPCATYVAIRAVALPFVVLSTIAQAISIGTKDTRTPMLSVALAGAFNFFGDLLFMKGFGLGIAGAAWATSMSQILSAGLLLRVLKRRGFLNNPDKEEESTRNDKITDAATPPFGATTVATVRQLLSFIPFLFIMAVKIGWHNSCSATAASLGGTKAAAHTALISVAMVCMLLGDVGSSLAQAFLPAFLVLSSSKDTADTTITNDKTQFDLQAAMPTIKQLLKCTLSICHGDCIHHYWSDGSSNNKRPLCSS